MSPPIGLVVPPSACGALAAAQSQGPVMKLVLSMNTRDYFNSEVQKLFQQ